MLFALNDCNISPDKLCPSGEGRLDVAIGLAELSGNRGPEMVSINSVVDTIADADIAGGWTPSPVVVGGREALGSAWRCSSQSSIKVTPGRRSSRCTCVQSGSVLRREPCGAPAPAYSIASSTASLSVAGSGHPAPQRSRARSSSQPYCGPPP